MVKTRIHFILVLISVSAKKMKVCFLRWSERAFFTNLFLALALEAVSVVVRVLQNCSFKASKFQVSTGLNKVAHNVVIYATNQYVFISKLVSDLKPSIFEVFYSSLNIP